MFDTYSLKARLWPALLAAAPAAGFVTIVFPDAEWWHAGLLGTGAAAGLAFLLAQMGRSAGKRKEKTLFAKWGGKPTTRYLRHRHSPLDKHTLDRYHRNIERLSPELRIPNDDAERDDRAAADDVYEAATRLLIQRTRDTRRFPLVFKENVHYGFCRNLWGLKPIAIGVSALSFLACGALAYRSIKVGGGMPLAPAVVGAVSLIWVLLWSLWFTRDWVKVAADAYAERLLEASDNLVAPER